MFTDRWEKDWHIADGDELLAKELTPVFEKYLVALQAKGASKSTMNRHKNACHAIGGYIINQVFKYEWVNFEDPWNGEEILFQYVCGFDGPLIFHDNEPLQKEVDATSRKLYNFILNEGSVTDSISISPGEIFPANLFLEGHNKSGDVSCEGRTAYLDGFAQKWSKCKGEVPKDSHKGISTPTGGAYLFILALTMAQHSSLKGAI